MPLREQVRFCTLGAAVASLALAAWKHGAGKLDGTDAVVCAITLAFLGLNYAATLYAAACDNPPPPAPKAVAATAGAGA